ncbi:MAG: M20/M25/M40 family metallo-hydrolase [Symbiobacteriaceae bacterium]|nr:M20/M25/M40 family metallo-hydrolase [Symbiobacteriaceae bacterium]
MVLDQEKLHQMYFEAICGIPHVSRNEKALSDYIMAQAKTRGYWCHQDDMGNVVVRVPASPGYEKAAPVILQGHMDMVGTKVPFSDFDFAKDSLKLYIEEGCLKAEGTTLGADNGTAVAYMLALMADTTVSHPELECIYTVQEEIGCLGAKALDGSLLTASRMIGLDASGEHVTQVGNYCSDRSIISLPVTSEQASREALRVRLSGVPAASFGKAPLTNKNNAIKYLAELLRNSNASFRIASLMGGTAENAHPQECEAILVSGESILVQEKLLSLVDQEFKLEFTSASVDKFMSSESTEALIGLLLDLPNGPLETTEDYMLSSHLVGVVTAEAGSATIIGSTRCRDSNHNLKLIDEMQSIVSKYGATLNLEVRYRSWDYMQNSPLRELFAQLVSREWGKELVETICPGGLEIPYFIAKVPHMDAITMGPLTGSAHLPGEWLDLASFDRVYLMLCAILQELKN